MRMMSSLKPNMPKRLLSLLGFIPAARKFSNRWINSRSGLKHHLWFSEGEAPVTILDTSAGFDMVFKELGRIEYGIFA
jgi:hypothetical protein